MLRPSALLIVLVITGSGFGWYLDHLQKERRNLKQLDAKKMLEHQDFEVSSKGEMADLSASELHEQLEYLKQQNQELMAENSSLIDQLASLRGQVQSSDYTDKTAPKAMCTPADAQASVTPDFTGIGMDLIKLRGIKDIPTPVVGSSAEVVQDKIWNWLKTRFIPEQGALQGKALYALGAIPRDLDTLQMKAQFWTYQIGAWFDASEKNILLVRGADGVTPEKENALGLAYSYLFKRYGENVFQVQTQPFTLDSSVAKEAVLAGDANHVRFIHALQNPQVGGGGGVGEDPDDPSRQVPIPNFLRELELLPYAMGLDFMQAMHSIGGWEQVDAVYQRLPISTAEVLDSQVYFQEPAFELLNLQWRNPVLVDQRPFWQDRLGPLGVILFLKQYVSEAIAAECYDGWQNDHLYAFPAADARQRGQVVWPTLWLNSDKADAFFAAARQSLLNRYRGAEAVSHADPNVFALEHEGRSIRLKRIYDAKGVLYIDATSAAAADAVLKDF